MDKNSLNITALNVVEFTVQSNDLTNTKLGSPVTAFTTPVIHNSLSHPQKLIG
jgi:hypothetical protein